MLDLSLIFALLLAFAVYAYVALDGLDLGVGMLAPFARSEDEQDIMISSIAPVWDGNETWLVFGGGGLMAAFPLAYSILLPAFYAPLLVMLLALIFRGVAFEFRHRNPRHIKAWTRGFVGGSYVAVCCQGVILGAFVQGIRVQGRQYAGGWFDWLTPFSVFTALALVCGYSLLGACWLVMKTEGGLQRTMHRRAKPLAIAVLVCIAATSLWTPFLDRRIAERWFSWPNIVYLSPAPILAILLGAALWRALASESERLPLPLTLLLFLVCYAGLGISAFPLIAPPSVSIWAAASPPESLKFVLAGAAVLVPLIVIYSSFSYWVFRGKTREKRYH
jgi:cytochrome bd ubiquinol oxidase subunit II